MTKNPKFSGFRSFYAFLLTFRQTSWIGMFQRVDEERVGCPVVFYVEMIAMIRMKKSQIDTENDKNPENFLFSNILRTLPKISTNFVNCNIETGQQGKNVLSTLLRKEMNAVFQTKTVRN